MSTTEMIQSTNNQQKEQKKEQIQVNRPIRSNYPRHPNQTNQQTRPNHPNQHNQQTRPNQQARMNHSNKPVYTNHRKQDDQPTKHVKTVRFLHPDQTVHPVQPTKHVKTVRFLHPDQTVQYVRPVQTVQTVQPVQTVNKAFFDKIANSTTTIFGRACIVFTAKLFKQVFTAVTKRDPKSNFYQVFLDKYDYLFKIDTMPQYVDVAPDHVKFQIHELLYGPLFNLDGKEDFCTRFDDLKFWKNQWGFKFSPFRVVQKLLKDNGLYFVDHTFKGNIPFLYLYRQLPARDVVKHKPWHNNYTIPELSKKDFAGNMLAHSDVNIAVQGAFDKFVAMYMAGEFF